VPIFDPNTRLKSFFHPLNIVELSQKNVCAQEANLGKVAKTCTTQIKGSIFKKYIKTILPTFVQNTVLGLNKSAKLSSPASYYSVIQNVRFV